MSRNNNEVSIHDVTQRSEEWYDLRRGLVTASELSLLLTPTLKPAANAAVKLHLYDLLAQRVTGKTPDRFVSWDMERGQLEETDARMAYNAAYETVQEVGFITRDWKADDGTDCTMGYSPDGLVGDDGLIEIKSRKAKIQFQTILEHMIDVPEVPMPKDAWLQVQGGLFASCRAWCDYVSYSNGLNLAVIRITPDPKTLEAIEQIVGATERALKRMRATYDQMIVSPSTRITPVEFVDYSEEIAL